MYTSFCGIDPGKTGSVAVIRSENKTMFELMRTPVLGKEYDISGMAKIITTQPAGTIFILERAQAMPGQGVVSMFEFGRGYGIWLAILAVSMSPHVIVHSRVWTKKMLAGAPGKGKERSMHVARMLFPFWAPKFKNEYQFADSILLAEYGKRLYAASDTDTNSPQINNP